MTVGIFIDGAIGTTGLEIRERLMGRKDLSLIMLSDDQRKDVAARREALNAADIVILCLPDDAAREAVALIDNPHTRVIDASTAHRTAPHWIYGLPEIETDGRAKIAEAKRVANPGCYATGFLALVKPLVRAGIIPAHWPLTANAVSGYSGGGKAMINEFEGGHANPAWRTYALSLTHKHISEMQQHAGLIHTPLFAPSVVNTYRGMIVDVPLMIGAMPTKPSLSALRDVLAHTYATSSIVNLVTDYEEANITVKHAADSDRMDLFVFSNAEETHVRLIAALDNLGKGAAGAAVQSLNLMAGLDEVTGLRL